MSTTGGRGTRGHARIAEDVDDSPNVLYLNLNVHVVELEAYQAEVPEDSGFYIPQDEEAAEQVPPETLAAALPPVSLEAVMPAQEQESLMETVMAALLQDLVGGADVREACAALPTEAETPFFYNFRDPSALDDMSIDSAPLEVPVDEQAAQEAAQESARAEVLQDAESQELITRVMENTVFNLLQEASHGEFNLS